MRMGYCTWFLFDNIRNCTYLSPSPVSRKYCTYVVSVKGNIPWTDSIFDSVNLLRIKNIRTLFKQHRWNRVRVHGLQLKTWRNAILRHASPYGCFLIVVSPASKSTTPRSVDDTIAHPRTSAWGSHVKIKMMSQPISGKCYLWQRKHESKTASHRAEKLKKLLLIRMLSWQVVSKCSQSEKQCIMARETEYCRYFECNSSNHQQNIIDWSNHWISIYRTSVIVCSAIAEQSTPLLCQHPEQVHFHFSWGAPQFGKSIP